MTNPITTHSDIPQSAPVTDDHIHDNFPCYNCTYNLRTLHTHSSCPECGHSTLDSLIRGNNHYNHIPWLKSISRGLACFIIFNLIAIFFIINAIYPVIDTVLLNSSFSNASTLLALLNIPLALAAYLLLIIAGILYTTARQSPPIHIKEATSRIVLKNLIIIWSVIIIAFPIAALIIGIFLSMILMNSSSDLFSMILASIYLLSITIICFYPLFMLATFFRFSTHITNHFNQIAPARSCSFCAKSLLYSFFITFTAWIINIITAIVFTYYSPPSNMHSFLTTDATYIFFNNITTGPFFAIFTVTAFITALIFFLSYLYAVTLSIRLYRSIKTHINTTLIK
ncbi:hypothetical protein [Poriferisphaera corsica]|uniref:hypothetical protein n=1 Tax=Poriferisphaera corsica TaxID=2528020 RepID=UPI001909F3A1|nr:hypothetical protein [Poriferisphaera corsica]